VTGGAAGVRRRDEPKALVLMYHRVAEVHADPFSLCVAPRHFAEQLEVLRREWRPMSLQRITRALASGTIPPHSVVLTFDDGYVDNLETAKPLLERHDTPATVFVTTGFVGQDREMWWDELERAFLEPGILPDSLSLTIRGCTYRWELGRSSQYSQEECRRHRAWRTEEKPPTSRHLIYFSVWRLVQVLSDLERRKVLDQIAAWAGRDTKGRLNYRGLCVEEVCDLGKGRLVDIGAHTVTHPALKELSGAAQRREVGLSKAHLEDILGRAVTSFAYPYGARSEESIAIVREAGFDSACATVAGVVEPGVDHFQLPRVAVDDWNGDEFEERLATWFDGTRDAAIWMVPAAESALMPVLAGGKWSFRTAGDNVARLSFPSNDPDGVQIEIDTAATQTAYDIQLNQPDLSVRANKGYEIEFRARAARPRSLSIGFAQAHEPWECLGLYETVEVTLEWQNFQMSFAAAADEDNGRIHFDAGGSDVSVELSRVSLRALSAGEPVVPGVRIMVVH
jgi:peptidoglycan/xylan/chitin deacetylase (PgdA/CDA1 family)